MSCKTRQVGELQNKSPGNDIKSNLFQKLINTVFAHNETKSFDFCSIVVGNFPKANPFHLIKK